jgi:hypothetical protein
VRYLVDANVLTEPTKPAAPFRGGRVIHSLIVVTRNRTDFEKAGVRLVDPFEI